MEEQKGISGSILETYRSLIAVRKASVALRRGGYIPLTCPDAGVWAFVRNDPTETVIVAINLGSGSTSTTLDLSAFTVPTAGTNAVSLENGGSLGTITQANRAAWPVNLGARSWMIARASITLPVTVSHPDIDGRNIPDDAGAAALAATQACLSSFGDNVDELDQLFVRADGDALRISISGNLPADGTSLDLFIDADPGAGTGQNWLVTAHLPAPPGGLAPLDGTTFDPGFSPDALYYLNTVGGMVYVDRVSLPSPGGALASKEYRGAVGLNTGRGVLSGGTNPNGVEAAIDGTNTLGITASSASSAASATTGLEIRIPFADLGLPSDFSGPVGVAAFLQRVDSVASNQWLPPLPAGSADLALAPNLGGVAGQQHAIVTVGLQGDLDGSGTVDAGDVALLLLDFGPCAGCVSDLDGNGQIDSGDLALLLLLFS